MSLYVRLIIILCLLLMPASVQAVDVNGDIYVRHYFNSRYNHEEVNGNLIGIHLEMPFFNGKLTPFIAAQMTSERMGSRYHFVPNNGDFGGGISSTWKRWKVTVKASSLHNFDSYAPVWEYNFIEIKYSWP